MKHLLDNPAWNALTAGNARLSRGNDEARYFEPEVSPFVGMVENTRKNFRLLAELVPYTAPVLFVSTEQPSIPSPWKVLRLINGMQMVCDRPQIPHGVASSPVQLDETHVPQMLELAETTHPGPFGPRTIRFGHYEGFFSGERLIAMAGQRLHPKGYAEVSAVCTHPKYTGKGYARQLVCGQLKRIRQCGETPFLHVRSDNTRAIRLYRQLGFYARSDVFFYVMARRM